MSSVYLNTSHSESNAEILVQHPNYQLFFNEFFPLKYLEEVETVADWGRYKIRLSHPVKGEINFKGREEEFIQDGKRAVEILISSVKGKVKDEGENAAFFKQIGKVVKKSFQGSNLIDAWKGLDQTHFLLEKELEVLLWQDGSRICFKLFPFDGEKNKLSAGIHVHDIGRVLYNVLPYIVYSVVAPLLVKRGIMNFSWSGYQTSRSIQVTYGLHDIDFNKDTMTMFLSLETKCPIQFDQKRASPPIDQTDDGVPRSLDLEVPQELLKIVGKYISWSPC